MGATEGAFRFDGRVAVVVGAGPGLGATLGRRLASAGAEVALVARSAASLEASRAAVRAVGADPLLVEAESGARRQRRPPLRPMIAVPGGRPR